MSAVIIIIVTVFMYLYVPSLDLKSIPVHTYVSTGLVKPESEANG